MILCELADNLLIRGALEGLNKARLLVTLVERTPHWSRFYVGEFAG